MKTSLTRASRGSVELLLVVPFFVLLTWGSAMVLIMLKQSGRLERAGWIYSTTLSHSLKKNDAAQLDAQSAFSKNANVKITYPKVSRDWREYLYAASNLKFTKALGSKIDLPKTFLLFLAIKTRERKSIQALYPLDNGFLSMLASRGLPTTGAFDIHSSPKRTQKVEVEIPGHNFKDKDSLAFAIGLESTKDTEYECIPFTFWGAKELVRAMEIGLNLTGISAIPESIIAVVDKLCPF